MHNLNKVMLIGNCAAKPEIKRTKNGKCKARLRVATNRFWKDDDGEHKTTEWHTVVAWEGLAESCERSLDKGSRVFVEGRVRTNAWTADDGTPRSVKEIYAQRVGFLDPRSDTDSTVAADADLPM